MRIIQILNSPNWSGASNYCIQVSNELMKLGHDVLLLTEPGKPLNVAKKLGIPFDSTIRLNHRNPYLYVHAMKRMKHLFQKFSPDIISAHINEGAWMAGLIAKHVVPEAVVARARTDIDPPKGHFINRYVHHHWTDHLIVGSNLHKKLCQEILDYPSNKVSVVYGGVDSSRFAPSSDRSFRKEVWAGEKDIIIGILARLDPVKGHEYAFQALSKIKNKSINFKVVALGYENERTFAWLKSMANELGIGENLYCFGFRDDLPEVLNSIDIGLISSVGSEANSRAALEFMATGKPVVATSVGVIPEIIQDGEHGYIVPPKDNEAMAEALEKLVVNHLLRNKMGNAARDRIDENFSLEKFGKVMERVYNGLLQNR